MHPELRTTDTKENAFIQPSKQTNKNMNGLTPDGPAGKICMDPHMRLPLTQPPMSVTSWFLLCCLHSNGTEQRRKPDQSGKHFQTLFTTVTVTKSSLEKKKC